MTQRRAAGPDFERRQAHQGRRHLPRCHGARRNLLESRRQGEWQLHGESDVYRAEIHEPQQPPASLWIFIAGNDMGAADQSYLYCAAYGNGKFIVRGFGPGPFQMNGFAGMKRRHASGRGNRTAGDAGDRSFGERRPLECSINGTVVAGYDKFALMTAGNFSPPMALSPSLRSPPK